MKRKLVLCFLAFALILGCASVMAAQTDADKKIKEAQSAGVAGATVTKQTDQTIKVTYVGEKNKEYVVMAVAETGVDSDLGRPTKEKIGTNTDGVLIYMDQVTGSSDGNVEFTVHPNLEYASKDQQYFLYISSNASNSAMTKIGSFTIDEVLELIGDVNGDSKINSSDITALVNLIISGKTLTDNQKIAADSNKDGVVNSSDITALVNLVIKG